MSIKTIKNQNPTQLDMQMAQFRPKQSVQNMIYPIYYETEQWLPICIPGIQDWYYISSFGRVYSKLYNCLIRPRLLGRGYHVVTLRTVNNTADDYLVHRLVLMAFKPIENPQLFQVNHINTIKTANYLENLEWVTCSENMLHAYENDLYKRGEDSNFAKLTNEQAHIICKGLQDNLTYQQLCENVNLEYNRTNVALIKAIQARKNWKYISRNYIF